MDIDIDRYIDIYTNFKFTYIYIQIYSDVMKTIQCAHPPRPHNGFVATCRLWTASGGVYIYGFADVIIIFLT